MDGTLLTKRSIDVFCESFGLLKELREIDRMPTILPAYSITEKIAKLLAGKNKEDMIKIFSSIPLNHGAKDFVNFLNKRDFLTTIATDSYQFLAEVLARELDIKMTYGNILEFKNGVITGRVLTEKHCIKIPECKEFAVCKLWLLRKLKAQINGINVCIGDGDSDACAFTEADIAIAFRPRSEKLKSVAHAVVTNFDEAEVFIEKKVEKLHAPGPH